MRLAFPTLIFTAVALLLSGAGVNAAPQHALTVYGEPAKYPASFSHFAYTNPQAPKGGTMRRSAMEIGHFDHILPYIDKGIGVNQIDGLLYSPWPSVRWTGLIRFMAWWRRRWSAPRTVCPCASI